eukprot:3296308-Rhodomonas_salina.1
MQDREGRGQLVTDYFRELRRPRVLHLVSKQADPPQAFPPVSAASVPDIAAQHVYEFLRHGDLVMALRPIHHMHTTTFLIQNRAQAAEEASDRALDLGA